MTIQTQLYWLGHSSYKIISKGKTYYIDPYKVESEKKADMILITHTHPDHLDMETLEKLIGNNTVVICTPDAHSKIIKLDPGKIVLMRPGQEIPEDGIKIRAYPAYNLDKPYHPREEGWVGYRIEYDDVSIYHAGDLDAIPEICTIKSDVIILPVSGVYVMNWKEAADITIAMKYKIAFPMHYDTIVGTIEDAKNFVKAIGNRGRIPEKNINLLESL